MIEENKDAIHKLLNKKCEKKYKDVRTCYARF